MHTESALFQYLEAHNQHVDYSPNTRFVTDVMQDELEPSATSDPIIAEISGIIYHKSKILLKAITRQDRGRWFEQLMITKPTASQTEYLNQIIDSFDCLLTDYRRHGVVDHKRIQDIGKMILKAPEMTSQIGKLIAHIVSTLEETDAKIEERLDSSIKKSTHFLERDRSRREKEQAMEALMDHLQAPDQEEEDDDEDDLQAQPFESFRHKFHPDSIIKEDREEDQETVGDKKAFETEYGSGPELPGHALQTDPLLNPGVELLDVYNEEDFDF
jgi:hypothetical protein